MSELGLKNARHLLVRTGLGVSWKDLKRYTALSRENSVSHIVHSSLNRPALKLPELAGWRTWSSGQSQAQRQRLHQQLGREKRRLREWVIQNMLETPYPLTERMVIFWHNHFTSSLNKVNQPSLILKQNMLFRHHSLGNFRQLLSAVSRDPAMLLYLDSNTSKKGKPNENFARELLELFTLGEGNFSEADVQGAAQAFTGWTVNLQNGNFQFRDDLHDTRVKSFLGKKGRFSGDHIIDMVLEKPQTAEHIAKKFWLEFVSDTPPNLSTIRYWGKVFYNANYDLRTLLITVLKSPEFWSAHHHGGKLKSPVELVIGTMRSLQINPFTNARIVGVCDALGQKILTPDTPKGYSGGKDWINTYTLPKRINLMSELLNQSSDQDIARIPELSIKEGANWLLAGRAARPIPMHTVGHRKKLQALLTDTAYQLT